MNYKVVKVLESILSRLAPVTEAASMSYRGEIAYNLRIDKMVSLGPTKYEGVYTVDMDGRLSVEGLMETPKFAARYNIHLDSVEPNLARSAKFLTRISLKVDPERYSDLVSNTIAYKQDEMSKTALIAIRTGKGKS